MKKLPDGTEVQKYQKEILKQLHLDYWHTPGVPGVSKYLENQTKDPFGKLER